MIFAGFPNPVGWTIDKVGALIGGAATAGFEALTGGLVAWVLDAVLWVSDGVFNFFLDSTDPNVQADWFITGTGPYATTVGVASVLLVGFVLAGIIQGVLAGDVAGMLRRMAVDLPISVLGMVGLVTITQALIALTDELAGAVLANFQADLNEFSTVLASLAAVNGPVGTAFVVFVLGLVTVLAGLVLVAELVIRSALIYIVVALAPLVFATRLWPATKGAARRCLELLVALIVSKLVIAIALAVAAAAAVGVGSGGEVTSLPAPEVFAEDPGGSTTQAVGILLAAAAAFGVAAFSPLLVSRLLPLTEAALVAQGVKGGPVRAGQTALMMANSAHQLSVNRNRQLAAGSIASGTGAAAPHPVAAAGLAAGQAAAAPVARAATAPASTGGAPRTASTPPRTPSTTPPAQRPRPPAGPRRLHGEDDGD